MVAEHWSAPTSGRLALTAPPDASLAGCSVTLRFAGEAEVAELELRAAGRRLFEVLPEGPLDAAGVRYQEQIEKVDEFIRFHRLPAYLAHKLHAYAEFLFEIKSLFLRS